MELRLKTIWSSFTIAIGLAVFVATVMFHCAQKFMDIAYKHFPPGILTVILAVLAAVTALPGVTRQLNPKESKWGGWLHALAIFIFCSLAALEMAVIDNSNKVNENHFQFIVQSFKDTQDLIKASQTAQARVAALPKLLPKGASPNLELKLAATKLSAEILQFLTDRQAGEPPLPRANTWDQDTQALIRYMEQTVSLESQLFGSRIIAIHDELAKQGLRDGQLDSFYEHPTNPIGIRIVGERIGALAERIK